MWDYESTAWKLAHHCKHLWFNLHCNQNGVTQISLRLCMNVCGMQVENIIKRAERSLLCARICQTVRKVKELVNKFEVLNTDVDIRLPRKQLEVETFIINAQMAERRLMKERQ